MFKSAKPAPFSSEEKRDENPLIDEILPWLSLAGMVLACVMLGLGLYLMA